MSPKDTYLNCNKTLCIKGRITPINKQVWGILNLTPDSFYDGGKNNTLTAALKKTEIMLAEGADVIDVGSVSTRSGADTLTPNEEWQRLQPILCELVKQFPTALFSIDTFWSNVASNALNEGARIINDITAGKNDSKLFNVVANWGAPLVMMHLRGTPKTMQDNCHYQNLTTEVIKELSTPIQLAKNAGVTDLIIDPGFGFSKTTTQNFKLLNYLEYFKVFNLPIMVGISRKSMIYKTLNQLPVNALNGTTALNTIALLKNADIMRVHDVKEAKETIKLINQLFLQHA
ncbi:MAG: dihydropteroate synthase [Bacteroidia bacterium]|nr:dihydropteroate synthase [Bacteroidia bacterium]